MSDPSLDCVIQDARLVSPNRSEGVAADLGIIGGRFAVCWNPAQRYGLLDKGDIAVGYDADLVLVDSDQSFIVRAAESPSLQGYTPFEGMELRSQVKSTWLRGEVVYEDGNVVGAARGQYVSRPSAGVS